MSRIWFVTGAGRGIGAHIAAAALATGDRVVATGRNLEALESRYASYGERVLCVPLDTAREADSATAVAAALDRFGRIDVLVNNAGYGQLGVFEEIAAADVVRQFETNVFGLMHVTRAALPVMRRQRSGHVINLASVGGFMGFAGSAVYCAAKFAVEGFSESLALEVQPFGIHVTIVEPGFFRTDFLDTSSVRYGALAVDDYRRDMPDGRTYESYNGRQPGDPARLGQAIVQLAGMAKPPLHFVAGTDALGMLDGALQRRRLELDAHRALSASTDGSF